MVLRISLFLVGRASEGEYVATRFCFWAAPLQLMAWRLSFRIDQRFSTVVGGRWPNDIFGRSCGLCLD
jgi:hypothetical protein